MISFLTLSRRRPLSYRNQSIDLFRKSVDWFYMVTASVLKGLRIQKYAVFQRILQRSEIRNIQVKTLRSFAEQKSINYFQMLFFNSSILDPCRKVYFLQVWLLLWPFQVSNSWDRFLFSWSTCCTLGQLLLLQVRGTVITNRGSFCY